MALGLLGVLEREAFEFYCDKFDINGSLSDESNDYHSVKKLL